MADDYSTYPAVLGSNQDIQPNNQVGGNQVVGAGALGGANGFTFAGRGGINGLQGLWLGAPTFGKAPFSVDLNGNMTARSLTISGFVRVGAAAADVNSTGGLSASSISTGTLNASVVNVSNINATNINTGTINGSLVGTGASGIQPASINVSSLSAITANCGAITTGTLTGVTVTGGTVQTATSGKRVVLNGAADEIDIFDASAQVATISGSSGQFITSAPSGKSLNFQVVSGASLLMGTTAALSGGTGSVTCDSGGVSLNGTPNLFGNTNVFGTFTASGAKSFDIPHPARDGYRLRYAALEGPEVLVVCRGRGKVVLPAHFTGVSEPGTLMVVRSGWPWNRTWIATAVRKGYGDYATEYEGSSPSDHPSGDEA